MSLTKPPDIPATIGSQILADYMRRFSMWLTKELDNKAPTDQAFPSFMLLSPGGLVWKVTITDAGALTAVQVPLGSHP